MSLDLQSPVEDVDRQSDYRALLERIQTAEIADRLKSDFLANMSHEIRSPMTAMLGYTEVLLSRVQEEADREALLAIKRSGDHLLSLVNEMLDLAKIESGNTDVDWMPIDPQILVEEVASLWHARAKQQGLELYLEQDANLPGEFWTDPRRLKQVLINLVGNAIKFTQAGSVSIRSRWLPDAPAGPSWEIAVIDTGIGLSSEQQKKLFSRFVQADSNIEHRYGGTGLGLSISLQLVELLGGTIVVESELGIGSKFRVTLPANHQQRLPADPPPVAAANDLVVKNESKLESAILLPADCEILLAEDGPDNRRLLEFLLRQAGARVTSVENGRLALEKTLSRQATAESDATLAVKPFSVLLIDMQMPFVDGYQVARRLRELGFKQPIVAITAHAMAGDRERCLASGCTDYLTKPIRRDTLVEMVAKYVGRRPQQS